MKRLLWLVIDSYYFIVGHSRTFFYKDSPKTYQDDNNSKGDIILIPGFFTSWHSLKNIGDHFAKRGWRIHIIHGIGYNKRAIRKEAQELNIYIEDNYLDDVIVIAHSKGGLVAKHYLDDENTDDRVKKVIAIASPFSGTHSAKMVPTETWSELSPQSKLVEKICKDAGYNNRIVSIYPEQDSVVIHNNKSFLEGAKNITLKIKGHHSILFDKELINTIEKEIE